MRASGARCQRSIQRRFLLRMYEEGLSGYTYLERG